MYDEYHEYRVDTQRWQHWPKALIMTHEWSTDGCDRRLEQRRYVPDNYAVQLEMENRRIKAQAEYEKKLADVALEEAHEIQHNIDRLRERIHEVAADRDRIKAENAKLQDLIADMSKAFLTLDIDHCQACPRDRASRRCQMFAKTGGECAFVTEMRKLGIEVDG